MIKKYLLYLLRWQLSTPILAICVITFATLGTTWSTILANLFGGLIFFWVDRWIFANTNFLHGELWEVAADIKCSDCGEPASTGYRLVRAGKYDRTDDREPEFRCQKCSKRKYRYVNDKHDLPEGPGTRAFAKG